MHIELSPYDLLLSLVSGAALWWLILKLATIDAGEKYQSTLCPSCGHEEASHNWGGCRYTILHTGVDGLADICPCTHVYADTRR